MLASLAFAGAAVSARAETAEAGRIEDRLPADQQQRTTPDAASTDTGKTPVSAVQPFILTKVGLRGNSAISVEQISRVTAPFVGKLTEQETLARLASAVTTLYRDNGYFLSRAIIRPQEIHEGVLQVDIIEGYVDGIKVEGMQDSDAHAQFAATLSERPTRRSTFERELLLLSDRYGFVIDASQLLPDAQDTARFTLNLRVSLRPVALRLYTDNRGTTANGPEQAFASLALNSLAGTSDRLTGSLFVTPSDTKELFFASANYAASWLGGDVWTEVDASVSRTQDGTDPFGPVSTSKSDRLFGKLSVPLERSRAESLWLAFILDRRDSEQFTPGDTPRDETLVMLRGSLALTEAGDGSRTDIFVEGTSGLSGLGASRNGDAALSHDDARPQFAKLRVNASSVVPIWSGVDLQLLASGQIADGALPASEELGLGGARFGRAFDYSAITGDIGWAASAELRYTFATGLPIAERIQFYAFADGGEIWNLGVLPLSLTEAQMTSAGGGLRIMLPYGALATIEAAQSIGERVPSQRDSTRFFFSLSWAM